MAAVLLQLSPNRSPTLSLLALSPRPEPHRHQRVCHHLESTEILRWRPHRRRRQQRSHRAPYTWPAAPHATQVAQEAQAQPQATGSGTGTGTGAAPIQRASFKSVQHSQNGQRGLCLAHVNGSKLSEHMRTHQQGGQLNGPTCNITSIISVKLCALVSLCQSCSM